MMLFSFIQDIVDDHRRIADKHDPACRLEFLQRFCKWEMCGGKLDWIPRFGWGVLLRNWVRMLLKDAMKETPFASSVIACLLTEWDDTDQEQEVMDNMLHILRTDYPNGPPQDDNDP